MSLLIFKKKSFSVDGNGEDYGSAVTASVTDKMVEEDKTFLITVETTDDVMRPGQRIMAMKAKAKGGKAKSNFPQGRCEFVAKSNFPQGRCEFVAKSNFPQGRCEFVGKTEFGSGRIDRQTQ